MISPNNTPINNKSNNEDFTLNEYEKLLETAKKSYQFVSFKNIDWDKRFILWRHDVDYSLNRALELAKIEGKNKVTSTYFININSEFYNLMESSQSELIKKIISFGHDIGIHLDTSANFISKKNSLEEILNYQKKLFIKLFDLCPTAFSFHNPQKTDYNFENFLYEGLVNCYSKKFKDDLPYCSDSNGYWRFRRLKDVLNEASDYSLQVLTHPGWWQDKEMSPRMKIARCIYGRALSNIEKYDNEKENDHRLNFCLFNSKILFLRDLNPKLYKLFDFLHNNNYQKLLILELWELQKKWINNLCISYFIKNQNLSDQEAISYFKESKLTYENLDIFINCFGQKKVEKVIGIEIKSYRNINEMIKKINSIFENNRIDSINYLITNLSSIIKNIYMSQIGDNVYSISN